MGMLKILGLKGSSEPYVTEDELKLMLRGAELSGAIEEEEQLPSASNFVQLSLQNMQL
ncbi:CBS domain-containing protein [Actinidia rufa]|uniref:CBS domain-containing protein n=1 Tax=Actinidia rufa TaxID=165716 RepID=A0A7J0HG18_9ERIC|nr:CBS domain-containing protein [Actinidia rufa]